MKTMRITSIVILAFIGVNALAAGYAFMADPDGSGLGISIDRLKHSPFNDYFIPGLVLFTANGVFNIVALILVIKRYKYYPLVVCMQGIILLGWIIIQIAFLGEFNFLHVLFIFLGLSLLYLGMRMNKLKHHG